MRCSRPIPNTPKMWTPTPNGGGPFGNVADVSEPRKLVVPMLTFKDDMTVFVGDNGSQIPVCGHSHTWGDMMAYLPKQKILFAGDVGFFWVAPYANNSYISKWLDTCDRIAGWDVEMIVPATVRSEARKNSPRWPTISAFSASKRASATNEDAAGVAAAEIRLGRSTTGLVRSA